MKKIVIAFLSGALLMVGGQALADPLSNFGKKVDAEYSIVVNGKMLEAKTVAVDGVTFTPNRALSDAIGYDVAFKDKVVYYTKREEAPELSIDSTEPVTESRQWSAEDIRASIELTESRARFADKSLKYAIEKGDEVEITKWEAYIEKNNAELALWLERKAAQQ
ncbi:hypothetical protein [Cohnella luojiensis]|uniref:Copper amine oxidase-like N-terminal domain-containing protein n=1 Tax=Cohnella luojiensis TaxID=652876 RepID=A0A4Y8M7B1_9BACL|nr:hypothetical protein [Cohnella luojiensis]TFE30841.1 hypothetical protein E2980_03430 [Cohnella luojiensis]